MFRNATFKLTMSYLAIVMVISLGFSIMVYHFTTNELEFGLNHQTQRIYRQFPVFSNNPYLQVLDNDVNMGAHHMLLRLAYFNVLVLVAAGFTSYWLARRTLEPIEVAHDRQKRFTADVSHELRTPLTALKMGSEVALLDKDASKAELQEALKSNVEEANRMEQLINSLLRLTRLENNELVANFTNISSSDLTSNAIAHVRAIADSKHITIEDKSISAIVHGDTDSLTQLLVILLDNAIKYSPAKTIVRLTSRKSDGVLELKIKDAGAGISQEALPHVFERFYRQDAARTTSNDGAGYGLGLSIAKMIADRNGINIMLISKLNKGTTAVITLPLATVPEV